MTAAKLDIDMSLSSHPRIQLQSVLAYRPILSRDHFLV